MLACFGPPLDDRPGRLCSRRAVRSVRFAAALRAVHSARNKLTHPFGLQQPYTVYRLPSGLQQLCAAMRAVNTGLQSIPALHAARSGRSSHQKSLRPSQRRQRTRLLIASKPNTSLCEGASRLLQAPRSQHNSKAAPRAAALRSLVRSMPS